MIADKGDVVIYIGNISYAKDQCTRDLMNEYLKEGEFYTIYGYTGNMCHYKNHYKIIIDELNDYRYFPVESFKISNREFLKKKYCLK